MNVDQRILVKAVFKNQITGNKIAKIISSTSGFEVIDYADSRPVELMVYELGETPQQDIETVASLQFFCRVEPTILEDSFDRMREEMAAQRYIPMITYEKGEHIVQVARKPKTKYRSVYVNLVFLIITIITTTLAGIALWDGYDDVPSEDTWSAESVMMGALTFSVPLLAILGVHELAHYYMARRRRIAASLPFFIPGPPTLIGTFGALISIRDPIPNTKAMLEIGVAGPLAGFALALPLAMGLILTNDGAKVAPVNEGGALISISFPAIYMLLEQLFPVSGDYILHPTAFAAWAGLFVTALNLLPVGQLEVDDLTVIKDAQGAGENRHPG